MEQDIPDLTARALYDFLSRCEVSERSQETIKSHILSIAQCVHESRLEAGLKGVPDCLKNRDISLSPNKSRRSDRILSSTEKRGRPDYAGQDDRPRHKKPKCAMCRKAMKASELGNVKNSSEGNSSKSGNAKSHEVQGDEAEPDEAEPDEAEPDEAEHDDAENEPESDDAENEPENDDAENEPENDNAENDDTGNDDTENGEAKTGQQAASENEDCQMTDYMQPPPGVANAYTDPLTVDNTEILHCGKSQDISGPLTPPGTNAPALGAHQAQPTTQIPASVTDTASLAPLLDCNSPVSCPPASDTDKEHKVMEAIFLCCLQFNFQLSRYRKQNTTTMIRTEVSDIQRHVTGVLKLPYGRAVDEIKKEHTAFHSKKMQMRYIETIFWHFIEEIAKDIKPEDCPVPRGPLDGFTRQEKKAHKQFMVDAGYKTGLTNVRHYRLLWKHLYTLREGGVDKILLYRTKDFTSFCESFRTDAVPSLLDTVMLWEEKYGPQIDLLERRIEYTVKNKMGEDPLRNQPDIASRLMVIRKAWNSDSNRWQSEQEASEFKAAHGPLLADNVPLGDLHDLPTKNGENRDMSMFVILKPQGIEKIMVCPVISIKPGDFLGIFSGEIRYSDGLDEIHGVPGPQEKLWLDYSRVTGPLNQMGAMLPDQAANAHLQWESYRPEKRSQAVWRVAVRAARAIRPFEEITRSACHELQYQLHQDAASARRGFLTAS